jgi:hypothetical protein
LYFCPILALSKSWWRQSSHSCALRAGVPLQILGDTSCFQDAEQSGGNVQAFLHRLDALIKTGSRIAFTEAWVAGVVLDGDTPESRSTGYV